MDINVDSKGQNNSSENIPSRQLLMLSVVSGIVYLVLAYLIFRYFHNAGIEQIFERGYSIVNQLLIGIASGGVAAVVIGYIASWSTVAEVLHDFYIVEMISKMQLTTFDRIQLSLFAGTGEEVLFRGAIQPLLGIWVTSVIFVGIHGYFKFKSIGHVLFGMVMFGLSLLLGYLFEYAGLVAAMSAHAVYDIIMLKFVQSGK